MKYSVSSYSFQQLLSSGKFTQLDCIPAAKELGFDGIEFVDIKAPEGVSKAEYALVLRAACEKYGLSISNFTFSADFLNGCDGDTSAEIKRVKGQIDLAHMLGAPSVRHDAAWGFKESTPYDGRGFNNVLPKLADACREVTEYAAALGIRTSIENHGTFCQSADRVERLMNEVAHPNFGWLCDIGNFLCVDESPEASVGKAAPYVHYVHAKDFHFKSGNEGNPGEGFFMTRSGNYLRGAILGHGIVPVAQCMNILMQHGYDGWIALEFEGLEDSLIALRIGLANLRRIIGSTKKA